MTDRFLGFGINAYPGSPLRGCVPDIRRCCSLLPGEALRSAGVAMDWSSLNACTDNRAHSYGIQSRIARTVAVSKPGDRVLIWYSGHGAQIATRDDEGEVDGYYECLCPVNFDHDIPSTWISDRELGAIFQDLRDGVRCYLVLDSCFSGGMAESARNGVDTARCYPPSLRLDFEVRREAARAKNLSVRAIMSSIADRVAVISGCLESQTCADTVVDGVPAGALTYYLWEQVLAAPRDPLTTVVARTADRLAELGYRQVPSVVGPDFIHEPFLAGRV